MQEVYNLERKNMDHYKEHQKSLSIALESLKGDYERTRVEFEVAQSAYFHTLEMHEKATAQITSLQPSLDNLTGLLHPMRRCNDDVLRIIFQWTVDSEREEYKCHECLNIATERREAISLGQVCKRWRVVAHGSAALWSQVAIDLTWSKTRILKYPPYRYLSRGDFPRDVYLIGILGRPGPDQDPEDEEEAVEAKEWRQTGNGIIDEIWISIFSRNLRTLHLEYGPLGGYYQTPHSGWSQGLIQDLCILQQDCSEKFNARVLHQVLSRFPPRKRLTLTETAFLNSSSPAFAFPDLKELRLCHLPHRTRHLDLLGVLYPAVEILEFLVVDDGYFGQRPLTNIIQWELSYLHTLIFADFDSMGGTFEDLGNPHAPNLTTVIITGCVTSCGYIAELFKAYPSVRHFDFVLDDRHTMNSINDRPNPPTQFFGGIFSGADQLLTLTIRLVEVGGGGGPGVMDGLRELATGVKVEPGDTNFRKLLPSLRRLEIHCGWITAAAVDELVQGRGLLREATTTKTIRGEREPTEKLEELKGFELVFDGLANLEDIMADEEGMEWWYDVESGWVDGKYSVIFP